MGYYLHYISTDTQPTNLEALRHALQQTDAGYTIYSSPLNGMGEIFYTGNRLAQIEINTLEDDIFEDELTAFRDTIGEGNTPEELYVLGILDATREIITIETLWEGSNAAKTLDHLDPLWDWLFANRAGILQADGEGFYNAEGLIVPRNFTF